MSWDIHLLQPFSLLRIIPLPPSSPYISPPLSGSGPRLNDITGSPGFPAYRLQIVRQIRDFSASQSHEPIPIINVHLYLIGTVSLENPNTPSKKKNHFSKPYPELLPSESFPAIPRGTHYFLSASFMSCMGFMEVCNIQHSVC